MSQNKRVKYPDLVFTPRSLGHSSEVTSSWTTGLESNKMGLGGDVFSIGFPTPLFCSAVHICTLEASVAKLLLLNVKLKYTCYFLHLRHLTVVFFSALSYSGGLTDCCVSLNARRAFVVVFSNL